MTRTEKLLSELIALPSVNPAFLPPQNPHAGEQRISEFLAATAARAGLDIAFERALPGRPNLLVRLSPRGKVRQRILLAPHLDTVNGREDQFKPRRRNGRLYGRGTCDTKGPAAAMFTALCELAEAPQRPAETEIVFAGLVDEENAQGGSRALVASHFKADLAIIGEPTRLQVATAHKGSLWLQLETQGKAAHSSRPELGRNAIYAMAQVIELLETTYAQQLSRRRHPLLGPATVSVGVVAGGTQPNIVPDRCTLQVDRRTLPGETESEVCWEIKELLRRAGLQASFASGKHVSCLPLETNPQLPLVARFLRAVGRRQSVGMQYFCDAAVLAESGIPSVVFGPGDIAQAHTADEWIALESLERGRGMLLRFLSKLP